MLSTYYIIFKILIFILNCIITNIIFNLFSYYKAAHILCPHVSVHNNESGIVVSLSTNSRINITFIITLEVQRSFNVL